MLMSSSSAVRIRSRLRRAASTNPPVDMSVFAALLFVSAVTAHPFVPQNEFDRERRGMTWSNFMPGGGMTMWSSANDDFWAPEPDSRLLPPPVDDWTTEPRDHGKDEGKAVKEEGAIVKEEMPGRDSPPPARPFDDDRERRPVKPWQRPGKKGYRGQDDEDRRYSGSNASVNAWFPIMFGVLPQDAKTKQSDASGAADPSADYDQPRTITAVANSVNHASRGLANAHTVLYAGEPPAAFRRMARSLIVF